MENQEDVRNERGPIAELYSELQSIPLLEEARISFSTEKATELSASKAILQSIEIAILNLIDLTDRMINDIINDDIGNALQKAGWLRDINRIILLTTSKQILNFYTPSSYKKFDITEIKNLKIYFDKCKVFDKELESYFQKKEVNIENIIANNSLNSDIVHLIYITRIIYHETDIWENNLARIFLPIADINYEEFIGLKYLRGAVKERSLKGDTYFTQFRAMHQIPEILTAELNDHLEKCILFLREKDINNSIACLELASNFSDIILCSLTPITDNLTLYEYHKIRENLGLTSGSHSVNIHFHLFRDLYVELTKTFMDQIFISEENYLNIFSKNFMIRFLESYILKISDFTYHWRDLHLHFPRNNVGGNFTKSLVGASDAVQAARKMKYIANTNDPLKPLRKLRNQNSLSVDKNFRSYLESEISLDYNISNVIGHITKGRFENVQNRTGTFSKKTDFKTPPKRKS